MDNFFQYAKHFRFHDIIFRDPIFWITSVIILIIFTPIIIKGMKSSNYGRLITSILIMVTLGFGFGVLSVMVWDLKTNTTNGEYIYSRTKIIDDNSLSNSNFGENTSTLDYKDKFNKDENNEYSLNPSTDELLKMEKDPNYKDKVESVILYYEQNEKEITLNYFIEDEKSCGHVEAYCKWCGNNFSQNKIVEPTIVLAYENSADFLYNSNEDWNNAKLYKYVTLFNKGVKTDCVVDTKDVFCSLKCKKEYELSN